MSINFCLTAEGKKRLNAWKAQGNKGEKYPVQIESILRDEMEDSLLIYIEPLVEIKDKYQLNSNKECKECHGYGWIRYYLDQDDCKSAPCHVCFPETATESKWLRDAM